LQAAEQYMVFDRRDAISVPHSGHTANCLVFLSNSITVTVGGTLANAKVLAARGCVFGPGAVEVAPLDQRSPEALGALQKAEIEKWWPIIKAANIKAE
jgi:hypothetical protein